MGFKLGTSKQPYIINGQVESKLSFKRAEQSVPGNPVIRVPLPNDIVGEANGPNHPEHPNSIYLNDKIDPNSDLAKQTLMHEMRHLTAMKISPNKLSYTDDTVTYEGNVYPRKTINGKDMIMDIETGQWKEAGDHAWPWEKDANDMVVRPQQINNIKN